MKAIISKAKGHEGIVMVNPNKPEYASLMVRCDTVNLNDGSFLTTEKRVGFINGTTEEIQGLVNTFGLKEGDDFSVKAFPVKILIKENTEKRFEGQSPKINPTTGEIITSGGQPVYRSTVVVPFDSPEEDERLTSDKTPVTAETAAKVEFTERQ